MYVVRIELLELLELLRPPVILEKVLVGDPGIVVSYKCLCAHSIRLPLRAGHKFSANGAETAYPSMLRCVGGGDARGVRSPRILAPPCTPHVTLTVNVEETYHLV